MSERPAVYPVPRLASAAAIEKRRHLKCDRDVKLHLPEALYDDLAQQARADSRAVSEYIRVLLERHLYGALGAGRG
jgi:hypothetical protein